MPKVCLCASITTRADELDRTIAATEILSTAVRSEPGTEVHLFGVDRETSTLWFFEVYTDEDALEAHTKTAAMAEYAAVLAGLTEPKIQSRRLQPLGTAASG
jgi:quinol monooxygenase YgiN